MMLNDLEIREHCTNRDLWFDGRPLVSPFSEGVQDGISYGLTSAGYDARLDGQVARAAGPEDLGEVSGSAAYVQHGRRGHVGAGQAPVQIADQLHRIAGQCAVEDVWSALLMSEILQQTHRATQCRARGEQTCHGGSHEDEP